jgi:ankyrin repeat protein
MLGTLSCQPVRNDPGRELVNACKSSKDETLKILNKGVDIDARSDSTFGWTPLITAIYHHKEDIVDLLLARGADVNKGDVMEKTPIVWAIEAWGNNTNLVASHSS